MVRALVLPYHVTMRLRLPKRFIQITAFVLVAVWLAGPMATFVGAVLEPAHVQCHCPGHHHAEAVPPGPAFSPCDHEASATAANDRFMVPPLEAVRVVGAAISISPPTPVAIPEGLAPCPAAPPPKPIA